jgi:hypothetical protein
MSGDENESYHKEAHMAEKMKKTDEEWKKELTEEALR